MIDVVITSSPGPIPSATSARCIAAVPEATASACLAPDVLGEAALELGGARPGGQPARADRVGDGGDLLVADRGRLETEEGLSSRRQLRGGIDRTKRTQSAARPARSTASVAGRRRSRGRRPTRSEPRRSGPSTAPGLAVDPHPARLPRPPPPPRRRPPPGARRARGRGTGRRRRRPRCPGRSRSPATGSPSAADERELVQVDAEHGAAELRVVAAAEPGGELDDVRPALADDDLRVGRAVARRRAPPRRRAPRRPRRRPARARASSARRARARRRRRAARRRRRSVTVSGVNSPVDRERVHGHLAARDELLDEDDARSATRRARARTRPRAADSSRTSTRPFCPWRSGALTTHG